MVFLLQMLLRMAETLGLPTHADSYPRPTADFCQAKFAQFAKGGLFAAT